MVEKRGRCNAFKIIIVIIICAHNSCSLVDFFGSFEKLEKPKVRNTVGYMPIMCEKKCELIRHYNILRVTRKIYI